MASGITRTFFLSPVKFSRYQRLTLHKSSQRVKFKDLSLQKESAAAAAEQPTVSPLSQTHSGNFSLDHTVGRWWFCVLVFNVSHLVQNHPCVPEEQAQSCFCWLYRAPQHFGLNSLIETSYLAWSFSPLTFLSPQDSEMHRKNLKELFGQSNIYTSKKSDY